MQLRLKLYRGKWSAVWSDERGQTRRRSLRTGDRELAEQRLADLNRRPAGVSAGEIYAAWMDDLAARGKDASRAGHAWKALAPVFAGLRPDQIDRPRCRAYTARRRRQDRSDGTIGKELGCLRAALRWRDRNSPAEIELPPRPAPRDRRLTRGEFRRLRLASKQAFHIWLFVVLGLATAARKQALLDLTWDRVDFERRQIRLDSGAAGKARAIVPMTRHARRALALAANMRTCEHVIEYAGRSVGSVKKGFALAAARAGLDDVTPHVLRHTAATWMAEAGIGMDEIAQFLGHGDSRITARVYARYSPTYLRRAASALE